MSNVLNPETESITLNTELETPILEPATELEQPSYESTSNPETAATPEAIEPVALDADATTEPVPHAVAAEPLRRAETRRMKLEPELTARRSTRPKLCLAEAAPEAGRAPAADG